MSLNVLILLIIQAISCSVSQPGEMTHIHTVDLSVMKNIVNQMFF